MCLTEVEHLAKKHALENAVKHGSEANVGAVMGAIMSGHAELRSKAGEVKGEVVEAVKWVNSLTPDERQAEFDRFDGEIVVRKQERREGLPPLRNAVDGEVVMRFAPGPSGPLHIGHSRAVTLNDEYAKMYNGKLILRFEDTNPDKIDPEAYDMIPEDMEWLGCDIAETYYQSDRFEIYYELAEKVLRDGNAYICLASNDEWRNLKAKGEATPDRDRPPKEQLELWQKMLNGDFQPWEAFYVVKTDIKHKNPAIRDFVGFKIVTEDHPHPRTGTKWRVYPLYNFAVVCDDHLMGITHVIRGKDHLNNTHRQKYLYRWLGWELPEFLHYGWVSIPNTVLKTSKIREGIINGDYTGWDDVRAGTFRSLNAKGYSPKALRQYWIETGIKAVDINFSWDRMNALDKKFVDNEAKRLFYVRQPVRCVVNTNKPLIGRAPFFPDEPNRGFRNYNFEPVDGKVEIYIEASDLLRMREGQGLRLKDLCDVVYEGSNTFTVSKGGNTIVHWVAVMDSSNMVMDVADGDSIMTFTGKIENAGKNAKGVAQFERIGFVNIYPKDGHAKFAFR